MPASEQILLKAYTNTNNTLLSQLTLGKYDTTAEGHFVMSGTANDGPLVGVAYESLMPSGYTDYANGTYILPSGAAWPSAATPSSGAGQQAAFVVSGFTWVIAASAINVGDRLNQAATTTINGVSMMGAVKTVSETPGTKIFEVGIAQSAATAAGQIVRVELSLQWGVA